MRSANSGNFVHITPLEFFKQAQQKNEYVGLVELSKADLYEHTHCFVNYAKQFFKAALSSTEQIDKTVKIVEDLEKESAAYRTVDKVAEYESLINDAVKKLAVALGSIEAYLFVKCMVATSDYLTSGGFYDILTGHWDPEIEKYLMSPGIQRGLIHTLFGPDRQRFIMFNSTGKPAEWIEQYHSVDDIAAAFDKQRKDPLPGTDEVKESILPGVNMYFREKYGTVVPFITTHSISRCKTKTFYNYCTFFRTTKINVNADLSLVDYSDDVVMDHQRTVNISIDDPNATNLCKSLMIAANFENYSGYGITINSYDV